VKGPDVLAAGVREATTTNNRLFGFFGGAHLPFQTADGEFNPTRGAKTVDVYSSDDILENPTLADCTEAALAVLKSRQAKGIWMMVEAGDVDWANHNNNLDDSIGAVFSGEAAFKKIVEWVEANSNWDETLLIVTADHGHLLNLTDPEIIARAGQKKLQARPGVK
jgi:alkaline phosphatase